MAAVAGDDDSFNPHADALSVSEQHVKRMRRDKRITHAPGSTKITQPGDAAASAAEMERNSEGRECGSVALWLLDALAAYAAETRSTLDDALRESEGLHVDSKASMAAETALSAPIVCDVEEGGVAERKSRNSETSDTQRWASSSRRLRWWRTGQCVFCNAFRV
jgi:hypothetical protein